MSIVQHAKTKAHKSILKDIRDVEKTTTKTVTNSISSSNQNQSFIQTGIVNLRKNYNDFGSLSMKQRVDRAEALLSLIQVETNTSFRAAEDIIRVVKTLDPHSTILQKIQLGRTKLNYLSTHGLGAFKKKTITKENERSSCC